MWPLSSASEVAEESGLKFIVRLCPYSKFVLCILANEKTKDVEIEMCLWELSINP